MDAKTAAAAANAGHWARAGRRRAVASPKTCNRIEPAVKLPSRLHSISSTRCSSIPTCGSFRWAHVGAESASPRRDRGVVIQPASQTFDEAVELIDESATRISHVVQTRDHRADPLDSHRHRAHQPVIVHVEGGGAGGTIPGE